MNTIQQGIYKHYKNKYYKVIGVAMHTETMEQVVVYQSLYDDFAFWVRPLDMFLENVEIEGVQQPRFAFIPQEDAQELYSKYC